MVKSDTFKYNVDKLRDQAELGRWWVRYPERYNPLGVAPENVWSIPIPVQGSWSPRALRHACPFPSELVRRILLLSTDRDDVVFDPFAGSGMVLAVAEAMGRRAAGIELSPQHVDAYRRSVRPEVLRQWKEKDPDIPSRDLAATILELRAVKYVKVLLNRFQDNNPAAPIPTLGAVFVDVPRGSYLKSSTLRITVAFVLSDIEDTVREDMIDQMNDISRRPPLSKFGVSSEIQVVDGAKFVELAANRNLFAYEHGHTWASSGLISSADALLLKRSNAPGKHVPIVANVKLNVRFPEHD